MSFCFTDIEGSTRLFRRLPQEYPDLLAEHQAVIEAAAELNGGVVVTREGDAFFLAFDDAAAAVQACIEAQRGLAAGKVRVRMGIHTGRAEARNGDYVAIAVHQAARVAAAAHGGQVVVSDATAAALRGAVPLRDLGEFRLRDFEAAERIHQVLADGLTDQFPVLRALPVVHHNLPARRTGLVGREREVRALTEAVEPGRLVTVLGPGGAGKTSVALAAASILETRYGDGVWFADLAPLGETALVASAVAQAVGVAEQGAPMDAATVAARLADKQVLVLLDNCEHVVSAVADLADRLLAECPQAALLATSREALGVLGERQLPLGALADPSAQQLFSERASAVRPEFAIDDRTAPLIREIVRAADGLPLAIELAAAKVGVMGLAELARGLERQLELFGDGPRVLPGRQRSVEALVRWSDDLLEDSERTTFRRLAIFRGGFTSEAVELVTGARRQTLHALTAKSLVSVDSRGRYRMLIPVWLYAREQLRGTPEAHAVAQAHFDWCRELAARIGAGVRGHDQLTWLDRVELEQDNLRVALRWGLAEDPVAAMVLATDVLEARSIRGHGGEARADLLEAMRAAGDTDRTARARAGVAWARSTALYESDPRALDELSTAEPVLADDPVGSTMCLIGRAEVLHHLMEDPAGAQAVLERAAQQAATAGAGWEEAYALLRLAATLMEADDIPAACKMAERAAELFRVAGDDRLAAVALHTQCLATAEGRDFERSRALGLAALGVFESMRDKRSAALASLAVAVDELFLGNPEGAREQIAVSVALAQEAGVAAHVYEWLDAAALHCATAGAWDDARRFLDAAEQRHPSALCTGLEQEMRRRVAEALPYGRVQAAPIGDTEALALLAQTYRSS